MKDWGQGESLIHKGNQPPPPMLQCCYTDFQTKPSSSLTKIPRLVEDSASAVELSEVALVVDCMNLAT